jgi:hypothetical protein
MSRQHTSFAAPKAPPACHAAAGPTCSRTQPAPRKMAPASRELVVGAAA